MPKVKKYRLKEEARQFFTKEFHNKTMTNDDWVTWNVGTLALEEVKEIEIKITNGHVGNRFGTKITHLNNWSGLNQKGELHFTLEVLNIGCGDFKAIELDKLISKLQTAANKFFED